MIWFLASKQNNSIEGGLQACHNTATMSILLRSFSLIFIVSMIDELNERKIAMLIKVAHVYQQM
jgi:hypothetical protein